MDIKYPIENKYMECVLQINRFSGLRPWVRSNCRVGSGQGRGGDRFEEMVTIVCLIDLHEIAVPPQRKT